EAAAVLALSPRSPNDESVPAFDIARIEQTGDAVIAGRAAPGAVVELLRNGERHDHVVADQSGQFVMVPPRLPLGNYELTLRSSQPNGRQATSEQSVMVALDKAEPGSSTVGSRAAVKFDAPQIRVATGQPPRVTAAINAAPRPDGGASPAVAASGIATAIVSRGDSLWRISRSTYGAGMRYAVVYKANRNLIRNPDLIYPGQIFVLPGKTP
ncbi:MAG: LysM peptidoglycan-binding domain-containing protein, partial [Bradyrhizobium sp.]